MNFSDKIEINQTSYLNGSDVEHIQAVLLKNIEFNLGSDYKKKQIKQWFMGCLLKFNI